MSAGGSGAASLDELTLRKVNDFVDDDLLSCFLCAQPHASHPLRRFAHLSLLRPRLKVSSDCAHRGGGRECCGAARVGVAGCESSQGD